MQRSPGSRACCFSTCSGSSTTQGREPTRESSADTRAAFPFRKQGRHPETDFSKLNSPARRYLCLRFTRRLAASSARLEAKVVRYSFLVGLFHSQQHAGLSRRSCDIRYRPPFRRLKPFWAFRRTQNPSRGNGLDGKLSSPLATSYLVPERDRSVPRKL